VFTGANVGRVCGKSKKVVFSSFLDLVFVGGRLCTHRGDNSASCHYINKMGEPSQSIIRFGISFIGVKN